jgi:rod shape determining protein RodA
MLVVLAVDFSIFSELAYKIYGFAISLQILVLAFGAVVSGSRRWFSLFGVMYFQPSELAKVALVLAVAKCISEGRDDTTLRPPYYRPLLIACIMTPLVYLQPDLGTSLLFLPVTLAMLYVAGAPARRIGRLLFFCALMIPPLWFSLKDYQQDRLRVFFDPDYDPLGAGYNIIQSKIAIGSGGIFGKGWLSGSQTQLSFIPEHHTDFIFAVIGEEWGFAGCVLILCLYLYIIVKGIKIALRARREVETLTCFGLISIFSLQVGINIGMNLGILPVTGLTLPFLSHGGSSLAVSFTGFAMLMRIDWATRRRSRG